MKLIIDIDERAYNASLELKTDNDSGLLGTHLINATANGIPLENIKTDMLKRKYEILEKEDWGSYYGLSIALIILDKYIKENK